MRIIYEMYKRVIKKQLELKFFDYENNSYNCCFKIIVYSVIIYLIFNVLNLSDISLKFYSVVKRYKIYKESNKLLSQY